jgi:deazaflavin-dependent oxidoreductase (nitroreductase family)
MAQSNTGGGMPPLLNAFMKVVLRSPIHGMVSKTVLLITFTGRKSGKMFTTPVSYSKQGDQVTIFTHSQWWKNLRRNRPVTLRIKGHDFKALPLPIADDKRAVAAGLVNHLKQVPFDARFYHVTLDANKNPNAGEAAEAAKTVVMIRLQIC